jgi:hypothetical protein
MVQAFIELACDSNAHLPFEYLSILASKLGQLDEVDLSELSSNYVIYQFLGNMHFVPLFTSPRTLAKLKGQDLGVIPLSLVIAYESAGALYNFAELKNKAMESYIKKISSDFGAKLRKLLKLAMLYQITGLYRNELTGPHRSAPDNTPPILEWQNVEKQLKPDLDENLIDRLYQTPCINWSTKQEWYMTNSVLCFHMHANLSKWAKESGQHLQEWENFFEFVKNDLSDAMFKPLSECYQHGFQASAEKMKSDFDSTTDVLEKRQLAKMARNLLCRNGLNQDGIERRVRPIQFLSGRWFNDLSQMADFELPETQ